MKIILLQDTTDELLYKGNSKIIEPQEDNEIDYWSSRIEHLKKDHQIINEIIETEYDKTIKSIKKINEPPKLTQEKIQRIQSSFEWRAKVKISVFKNNIKNNINTML